MDKHENNIIIIGAGPSGLACAYTLGQAGLAAQVIEKDSVAGGLSQTINFSDYLFDIGGHRFLTKSDTINKLWHDILKDKLLQVDRLSRIYYRKRFFKYPLAFFNTFWNLGPWESFRCISSYLYCKVTQPGNDKTFEGWIINRFGKRLYEIFFNTYTRKVWAVPCKDISADWAVQRIRGLSLRVALKNAIFKNSRKRPKTLAEKFLYPRRGPGEFCNELVQVCQKLGAQFEFEEEIIRIEHAAHTIHTIEKLNQKTLTKQKIPVKYLFSSMPLPIFIRSLNPAPPEKILKAAQALRYRSYMVINIIINKKDVFPDQWIYVHAPEVKLGRIQNYKNWSPFMTADPEKTSLGLEYFCTEGDDLWRMNDADLIDFAVAELAKIGIASRQHLITGFVVRRTNAYPVYDLNYQQHREVIKQYLGSFTNFQTIGRAGLFRYDNSDIAMLGGIGAANNFLGQPLQDLWGDDVKQEYLEMGEVRDQE